MMRKMKKYALMFITLLLCINTFSAKILANDGGDSEETSTYTATYEFVLEDGGELPEEVMIFLPEENTDVEVLYLIKSFSISVILPFE